MSKPNYTLFSISRQLEAFGCEDFEVGIFNLQEAKKENGNPMWIREWDKVTILGRVSWLKWMNSSGRDIYIRPAKNVGLFFIDDLSLGKIEQIKADGFSFALLVESSPQNYHGWLRADVSNQTPEFATACCKVLAERYQADINSADWRHFGRLAGFTNQKPKYVNEKGYQPFVKIAGTSKKTSEASGWLEEKAMDYIAKKEQERIALAQKLKEGAKTSIGGGKAHLTYERAEQFYCELLAKLQLQYGARFNASNADWRICMAMIQAGFGLDKIKLALLEHSPAVQSRFSYAEQYINRTLEKLLGKVQ